MKRYIRTLAVLLCCAVVLTTAAFAAGAYTKTISARFGDFTLNVNGQTAVPKDEHGNVVEPFISNGTTYLPVRGISQLLGKKVDWDNKNRVVRISDGGLEGTWKPEKASSVGIDKPTGEVMHKDFVLRLQAGGKGTTDLPNENNKIETFDITWKEDNGALTIIYSENDAYNWYGTVSHGVMVLYFEGSFITLTKV